MAVWISISEPQKGPIYGQKTWALGQSAKPGRAGSAMGGSLATEIQPGPKLWRMFGITGGDYFIIFDICLSSLSESSWFLEALLGSILAFGSTPTFFYQVRSCWIPPLCRGELFFFLWEASAESPVHCRIELARRSGTNGEQLLASTASDQQSSRSCLFQNGEKHWLKDIEGKKCIKVPLLSRSPWCWSIAPAKTVKIFQRLFFLLRRAPCTMKLIRKGFTSASWQKSEHWSPNMAPGALPCGLRSRHLFRSRHRSRFPLWRRARRGKMRGQYDSAHIEPIQYRSLNCKVNSKSIPSKWTFSPGRGWTLQLARGSEVVHVAFWEMNKLDVELVKTHICGCARRNATKESDRDITATVNKLSSL